MSDRLIVGSYNLRTPGGKDPFPNNWESRLPRIVEDARKMSLDIWGAQETIDFYDEYICAHSSYAAAGHGRGSNKDGEACSIYYNKERFEIGQHETFWLSETPEICSVVKGATYPRICTAGIFTDRISRKSFVFANTHLEHRVKELQKEQLEFLFARLEERYSGLPLVLTGDFNAFPESPACVYAMSKLQDARSISRIPVSYTGATYHGFVSNASDRKISDRIDYILVSGGIEVGKFDVVDNFTAPDTASSDHFPLRAEICFL